jgi:putative transposase
MKFAFVAKHRGIWPAGWLCEALGVSRGGFYAWLTRPRSARSRSDEAMAAKVRTSFIASDRTYGARRVWHDLLAEGVACGLHRIERLMRAQAMRARPRRRRLPLDNGERLMSAISPNLLDRQFTATAANRKWIADFTYIWTAEGWLYVAAVVDLFSRRVVGWSMSATMTAQFVADALMMAMWRRGKPDAVMHHSDRGSPVHLRAIPAPDGRARHQLLDEPIGQCLGQCRDGELLLLAQDRTHVGQDLSHPRPGQGRRVRLHRMLLQSAAEAFDPGLSQPDRLRKAGRVSLGSCQQNRQQLNRASTSASQACGSMLLSFAVAISM